MEADQYIYQYPKGDHSSPPCVGMLQDGFYFDCIEQGGGESERNPRIEEQIEDFELFSDEDLSY